MSEQLGVGAVVLAAGMSRRMGQPKLVMPWHETTVIGQVVDVLLQAQLAQIVVVTGGASELVEHSLRDIPVRIVLNPNFNTGEMLESFQTGLASLGENISAVLVVLGDQPAIEVGVVQQILSVYRSEHPEIIVPSYQMRRGHPWLIDRCLWSIILQLKSPSTLRDFLSIHARQIRYLPVDTPSVLSDIDTPEDYRRQLPKLGIE